MTKDIILVNLLFAVYDRKHHSNKVRAASLSRERSILFESARIRLLQENPSHY